MSEDDFYEAICSEPTNLSDSAIDALMFIYSEYQRLDLQVAILKAYIASKEDDK